MRRSTPARGHELVKHMSFVATVDEILPQEANEISELAETISYWNESTYSPEEWLRTAGNRWGPAGLAMRRGEEVLGFVVFGPAEFLPRAERLAGKLYDENTIIMACVSGDRRVKKDLIARMLKDLRQRGVADVEAVTSNSETSRHVSTRFLLENGWRPVSRIRYPGSSYTLMRTELGNTVEVGGLARGIIGRVKLPKLNKTPPVPGEACVQVELSVQVEPSPENGSIAVLTAEIPSGVVA